MWNLRLKAAIGTSFLAMTIGSMGLLLIWGVLSVFHASKWVIISGETLGIIAISALCVPVFAMILKNERERQYTASSDDIE